MDYALVYFVWKRGCYKQNDVWVLDKKVKLQQQQNKTKIEHKNPCRSEGIEPGSSGTQSGCVTSVLPSQLKVTIVVKLFNCFIFGSFSYLLEYVTLLQYDLNVQ